MTPGTEIIPADPVLVPIDDNIQTRRTDLQIRNPDFIEVVRQDWIRENNLTAHSVDFHSKAGLDKKKDRSRRPGLGRTGDGIIDGALTGPARKSAIKLGQAVKIEKNARLENSSHDRMNFF